MSKNIGLRLVLKRFVRSKGIRTLFNNLGHTVSCDDILCINTTRATGILEINNGCSTVPTNFREKHFYSS